MIGRRLTPMRKPENRPNPANFRDFETDE